MLFRSAFQNSPNTFTYNNLVNGKLNESTNPSNGNTGIITKNSLSNGGWLAINVCLGTISDNMLSGNSYISCTNSIDATSSIKLNNLSQASYIIISKMVGNANIDENTLSGTSYITGTTIQMNGGYVRRNTISANSYINFATDTATTLCWENQINSYSYINFTGAHKIGRAHV